jgi:hypothetical protein
MKVDFDRFYKYDELTKLIKSFVKKYPDLLVLESIGKSHEGRDIWVVTATNQKIPAAQKPAFWVDANIHATELTGSTAVLYLLKQLMEQYGKDERITRLLDTRALYLAPRVNPDGAEWAMADKPKLVRSSTRAYPFLEDPIDGLSQEDIDGDGRILMMRIKDANGPWKKHSTEPRMMVRREPTEVGGEYYRIVPEGLVKNYDGYQLPVNKNKEGLDLNRNFPEKWRQEFEQFGAGDYPTSEPEVRACVNFWTSRKNICGGVFFIPGAACSCGPMAQWPMKRCRRKICGCSKPLANTVKKPPATPRFRCTTSFAITRKMSSQAHKIGSIVILARSPGSWRFGAPCAKRGSRATNILIGSATIRWKTI